MTWAFTSMARNWYRQLKEHDDAARTWAEDCLGDEKEVFIRAMALVRWMQDRLLAQGAVEEPTLKAKLAVADRAFVLLWSAWNDALAGRYAAAAEHWRSLIESPQFLIAFSFDSDLARRWLDGRECDIQAAQKTIRRKIRDVGEYDAEKEWDDRSRRDNTVVQPYSHVTAQAALSTLAVAQDESGDPKAYLPRSQQSPRRTREYALFLASAALELLRACSSAFEDQPQLRLMWNNWGRQLVEEDKEILRRVYDDPGLSVETQVPPPTQRDDDA